MGKISKEEIQRMKASGYDPATIELWEGRLRFFHAGLELIPSIQRSFRGVVLGRGVGLSESRGLDCHEDESLLQERRREDRRVQSWEEIRIEELNHSAGGLVFMDSMGVRFHLPAYLVADLEGRYDSGLLSTLVLMSTHQAKKFELLDGFQKKSIRRFIRHAFDDPDGVFIRESLEDVVERFR